MRHGLAALFLGADLGPRVVVLNNAGLHAGKVVRAARAGLARRGIYLPAPTRIIEPIHRPE